MKKFNKRKIGIYSLICLSSIAVVSVGFSSWILNGSVSDDSTPIRAVIGTVIDKTIVAHIDDTESDYSIRFDNLLGTSTSVSNGDNTNVSNGDNKKEDLEFTIVYTLESPTQAINQNNFKVDLTFNEEAVNSYKNLIDTTDSKTYVNTSCLTNTSFTLPTTNQIVKSNDYIKHEITYDVDSNYKKVSIRSTFTFAWGSKFNYKNPGLMDDVNLAIYLNDFKAKVDQLETLVLTITPSYIKA